MINKKTKIKYMDANLLLNILAGIICFEVLKREYNFNNDKEGYKK